MKYNFENLNKIQKVKIHMIISFTSMIIIFAFVISILTINLTDLLLKQKANFFIEEFSSQIISNLNRSLNSYKTTGTLVFANNDLYEYDATTSTLDEYDTIQVENNISSTLYDICLMDNFIDFAFVYSNNHTVGKISNNTIFLSEDHLYEDMSSSISNKKTNDGWLSGYKEDYTRIYYVKRVNTNTILLLSFYTSELAKVLNPSNDDLDITVRLTDKNNTILFSPERNEIGNQLPSEFSNRIKNQSSATVMDNQYLISINNLNMQWYIICSIPLSTILKEKNDIQLLIVGIGLLTAVISILICIRLSSKLTLPVFELVNTLENQARHDLLTNILNKHTFENSVKNMLSSSNTVHAALLVFDIDNFKNINDSYGHAMGDCILAKTGEILQNSFSSPNLIGRIGGDEFCILFTDFKTTDLIAEIKSICQNLCSDFSKEASSIASNTITISIGVSFYPADGTTFEKLYQKADIALYASKKQGKDSYSIYED